MGSAVPAAPHMRIIGKQRVSLKEETHEIMHKITKLIGQFLNDIAINFSHET